MQRLIVQITAGGFLFFAIWALISPDGMLSMVGVVADNADARTELRAVYGGLELAMALILGRMSFDDETVPTALLYGGTALACVGGCRLLSAAFADVGWFTWALVLFELGAAGLNFWAWRQ